MMKCKGLEHHKQKEKFLPRSAGKERDAM